MLFELELFGIAIGVGALGGMLGIGGGVFIIPILTVLLHVPIKLAIGASLVSVIATSSAAGAVYAGHGLTHSKLAMVLEIATTSGAIAGGLIATSMNERWLEGLFAGILIVTAFGMGRLKPDAESSGPTGRLDTSFLDPVSGARVRYGVRHLGIGMGASVAAGGLSGLLGIGGGVIKVPIMTLVMRIPLKAAVATSNFMIGVTAGTSAIIYFSRGYVTPYLAVPTALGVLIGAGIEPRVGRRVRSSAVKRIFEVVLVVFAAQMLWKALHG
ncbi:MAG: sulfite exporter TauE/SafE family protein [Polyangia bacterium]